jgi:integrase
MARRPEGYQVDEDGGIYYLRFTHPRTGIRHKVSLRTKDKEEAHRKAPEVYARLIAGVEVRPRAAVRLHLALLELCTRWLDSLEGQLAESTRDVYEDYAAAHWLTRWKWVHELTADNLNAYVRERLLHVTRGSVRKEASALRGLLAWLKEEKVIAEVPVFELPPKKAGQRARKRRVPVPLSVREVRAILAFLPEGSQRISRRKGPWRGLRFPLRDYATFLWETGLRPRTVECLEMPSSWRPGATMLLIDDEEDKARWGREVPLSRIALELLERHAQQEGAIWGRWDLRADLRAAARRAGLDGARAAAISTYDLRHARINALSDAGATRSGVQLLAGHSDAATTERYLHPLQEQAREALALLERPDVELWSRCEERPGQCGLPKGFRSGFGSVSPGQGPLALGVEEAVCPVLLGVCAKGGT